MEISPAEPDVVSPSPGKAGMRPFREGSTAWCAVARACLRLTGTLSRGDQLRYAYLAGKGSFGEAPVLFEYPTQRTRGKCPFAARRDPKEGSGLCSFACRDVEVPDDMGAVRAPSSKLLGVASGRRHATLSVKRHQRT